MTRVLLHAEDLSGRSAAHYVGSPMYEVIAEHQPALLAVALFAAMSWLAGRLARRGNRLAGRLAWRYAHLDTRERFLFWVTAMAGAVHTGLVLGHELGWWTMGYAVIAAAEIFLAKRVLLRAVPRRRAVLILLTSILGYALVAVAGTLPDQVGLATKLIEIAALAVLLQPLRPTRLRRLASSTVVVTVMLVVGLSSWVGAFSGEDGHHLGETAGPGTLIPRGEDRAPDEHERRAADLLYEATVAGVAKYRDPAVAAADGYQVTNIVGHDFHAPNPTYQADGRILDPSRPENLIYAAGPGGPVLVGVMYESEAIGVAGPAVGGPLTVWHSHDHVCFSLMPPALAGLTSPFGVCPAGSVTIPITGEMLHVWTIAGAPERFGRLDDAWLAAHLEGTVRPDTGSGTSE